MTISNKDQTLSSKDIQRPKNITDDELLDLTQRQTFRYFWDAAHPLSGLIRDRANRFSDPKDEAIAIGGSGFGVMAIIVGCERGWISRQQAVQRISSMLDVLEKATCYHGAYPHFMNGATGATIPFSRKDDGGDLVETSFLFQGLLCARAYFDHDGSDEIRLRQRISYLWQEVEWNWYTQGGRNALTWHWSPTNGFALNHDIRGWNECLITYILAVSAPTYPIDPKCYHEGWAQGRQFLNKRKYEGIDLPLGSDWGGPLFLAHFSFCGLDPHGLKDAYADYWLQNVSHTRINHAYCVRNPLNYKGYSSNCWGLSAGDAVHGYAASAPDNDLGVINPSAALSSFCYAPEESMSALRHFYYDLGDKLWGRFGFVDGFSQQDNWYADTYLGISQGPIVIMIENYRTGLLWKLFMKNPEIQIGLKKLGFNSPYIS